MTRVLLAFDKFKDALTAQEAGGAVAAVLREQQPDRVLDMATLADGGEGFATILTQAAKGHEVAGTTTGPRGGRQPAGFGLVPVAAIPPPARARLQLTAAPTPGATVTVIEMAAISGLALLPQDQRDPWQTTTLGTGELMRAAAASGAVAVLLEVGGSATNDLGLGALAALGLEFLDAAGRPVHPPVPKNWSRIVRIPGRLAAGLPAVYIACDVTNPLLGPREAAAVYGPQKGLRPADHARLESEGARLAAADIVITGEGRFDESSLEGKGPGAVAARALALGKLVHVFAGQVAATARPGLALHAITPTDVPLAQALREAPHHLAASVRAVFAR